jgi:hypothetical protein
MKKVVLFILLANIFLLASIPYIVGKVNYISVIRTMEEFEMGSDIDIEYCLTAHFYDTYWYEKITFSQTYKSGLEAIKQTFFN